MFEGLIASVELVPLILYCLGLLFLSFLSGKLFWFIALTVLPELRLVDRKQRVAVLTKASNTRDFKFWSAIVFLLVLPPMLLLVHLTPKTGYLSHLLLFVVIMCCLGCQAIIPGLLARKSIRERLHQSLSRQ